MKQRSIDTMTPNKLAVYFVADMVLAYIDFPCGRYMIAPLLQYVERNLLLLVTPALDLLLRTIKFCCLLYCSS